MQKRNVSRCLRRTYFGAKKFCLNDRLFLIRAFELRRMSIRFGSFVLRARMCACDQAIEGRSQAVEIEHMRGKCHTERVGIGMTALRRPPLQTRS